MRICLSLILCSSCVFAQKNAAVPDPDPEIERKSFIVAPGFEVNLFAADPMLAKPIQMNWDARGRLWVATSETYPQIKPGQAANDKIIILEDTDGDGKADTTEVFADGLLIPTAVLPGDGGAYVANSTEIIHLSQSKPGIKADKKRVVLSGFGTEDTHHLIHTFRWGPDGAMYFNQSVYIHSHVETPHGTVRLNGGGIWRYEPRTQKLEVFARGFWNPWGLQFDKYGQMFATDGASGGGIYHVVPGASYPTGGNQASRVLHGMNPGSPKFCGLEIISGRHFPDDWQGDCITNDFRGHRVCRFKLRDAGSTFESREMTEIIKSNHPAFRPIDVSIGPDGALYIADWYNPIIQHGEVDFRDPRRDKTHGRIWRVTAKGRPLVEKLNVLNMDDVKLREQLKLPDSFSRKTALQRLYELSDRNETKVWNGPTMAETNKALAHFCAQSDDPKVRLFGLRALASRNKTTAACSALAVLDKPMDPTLEYALWLTLRELQDQWVPAFKEGKFDYSNDMKKLAFALEAVQSPEAVSPLLKLLKEGKIPAANQTDAWVLVAKLGTVEDVSEALVFGSSNRAGNGLPILQAVEASARTRKIKPTDRVALSTILSPNHFKDPNMTPVKCRLIGLWKLESQREYLEGIVISSTQEVSPIDRPAADVNSQAAMEGLALLGGAKSLEFLARLSIDEQDATIRAQALKTLIPLDTARAATITVASFSKNIPSEGSFTPFLQQKHGAAVLATALKGKTIPTDAAKIGLNSIRNTGLPSPALTEALTKAGNLGVAKPLPTPEEIKTLTVAALKSGDAARGELIFRRKEMQCFSCHAIGGAGGLVGPDLTSIGASAQPDYIVESLLLPNKAIKEGYHTVDVTTAAGRIHSGVKVREGNGELVLRDKDDKEIALRLDDVESRRNGRSLMPDGTTEPLTRAELLDLTRFLTELGKIGPYEPSKRRLVRRYDGQLYAKVNGELPLADLANAVSFKLAAAAAGGVKLSVNSMKGLTFTCNGTAIEADKPFRIEKGETTVTVYIDRKQRDLGLTVALEDVPESTARVSVVGGK